MGSSWACHVAMACRRCAATALLASRISVLSSSTWPHVTVRGERTGSRLWGERTGEADEGLRMLPPPGLNMTAFGDLNRRLGDRSADLGDANTCDCLGELMIAATPCSGGCLRPPSSPEGERGPPPAIGLNARCLLLMSGERVGVWLFLMSPPAGLLGLTSLAVKPVGLETSAAARSAPTPRSRLLQDREMDHSTTSPQHTSTCTTSRLLWPCTLAGLTRRLAGRGSACPAAP